MLVFDDIIDLSDSFLHVVAYETLRLRYLLSDISIWREKKQNAN